MMLSLRLSTKILGLNDSTQRVKEQNKDCKPQQHDRARQDEACKGDVKANQIVATNAESTSASSSQFCHAQLDRLLLKLKAQELSLINPRRKNGLIVYKKYHAEFVGPGAIIGGSFDLDAVGIIPVGNLSLVSPQNSQERRQAYKMRRQWVRLTKQIIDNPRATERAQVILNQFEHWFDAETVANLPDEAFALLVGVLPQTIRKVRNTELL